MLKSKGFYCMMGVILFLNECGEKNNDHNRAYPDPSSDADSAHPSDAAVQYKADLSGGKLRVADGALQPSIDALRDSPKKVDLGEHLSSVEGPSNNSMPGREKSKVEIPLAPVDIVVKGNKTTVDLIKKDYCQLFDNGKKMFMCKFPKKRMRIATKVQCLTCKTKVKIISAGKCDGTRFPHFVTINFSKQDSPHQMLFNADKYLYENETLTLVTSDFSAIKEVTLEDTSVNRGMSMFDTDCHIQAELTFNIR
jgi:hypothetical protein